MMICENQSSSSTVPNSSTNSTTPNFVRKFQSNFRPLDLRKLTLNSQIVENFEKSENNISSNSSPQSSTRSSVESSPKSSSSKHPDKFTSSTSYDSYHVKHSTLLKRQGSQSGLRESLLSSLLSPRTKEVDFIVPQTLSPLTPTMGRKGFSKQTNSGDSSPWSENEVGLLGNFQNSRANSPTPCFFNNRRNPGSSTGNSASGINPELYKSNPDQSESDGENDEFGNSNGRICFTLEYDNELEKLMVTVVKARNLSIKMKYYEDDELDLPVGQMDLEGKNDIKDKCYAKVTLFPDERRTLQSKPKKLSRRPRFDETFGFQISQKALEERSIKICLHEAHENSPRHKMLGYVNLPLKDINWAFGKQTFKEDLISESGELSPNIGEVLVSLCYNENIPRLTVTVFEAKGIKSRESACGTYAKIFLNQNTKILKTKKTATNPLIGDHSSFNESFNFKIPPESLDISSITIQMMYAQPGYNKGLDHWNEMLAKQKEQINYWQILSE